MSLETLEERPIVGLPEPAERITAVRVRDDGYWLVLGSSTERLQRWHVGLDGVAALEGTYPPVAGADILTSKLDGEGRLVQFVRASQAIVRRPLDGESEIVYQTTLDAPFMFMNNGILVTGP